MADNQRLPYIDVAKGFAIWLMIVGHLNISEQIQIYIYSFHIPLFFFISGIFFRNNKPFFQNLESAVRGLLFPYFFFSVINLSICWISPYLHPELYYNMDSIDVFRAAISGIFIGTDRVTSTSFLPFGPLWFLVALFVVRVFCSAFSSFIKNEYLMVVACFMGSITLFYFISVPVYSFQSAMLSTPFFCIGFLLRKIDFQNIRFKPIFFLLLLIYFFAVIPLNGKCDSDAAVYGNWMFVYYVNALVGIIITLLLSSYVSRFVHVIESVGKNTLVILGMHGIFFKFVQASSVFMFGYNSAYSLVYIIFAPLFVIFLCMVVSVPLKKYIPSAVGKKTP